VTLINNICNDNGNTDIHTDYDTITNGIETNSYTSLDSRIALFLIIIGLLLVSVIFGKKRKFLGRYSLTNQQTKVPKKPL
jgi:hypothetical protein